MMLLFSVIDLFIASRLFKIMLFNARVDATLDVQYGIGCPVPATNP